MAVTQAGSVIRITADNDTVPGPIDVQGWRYIGSADGSFTVKSGTTSGAQLLFVDGSADIQSEVGFRSTKDLWIDMAGTGAELFLYLRTSSNR